MNILLLSALPPCKDFSGSLLTYQMSKFVIEQHKLFCFTIVDPGLQHVKIADELNTVPIECITKLRERPVLRLPGILRHLSSLFIESYNSVFGTRKIVKKAVEFGHKHQIDAIWCIMQGQTIFRTALPVSKQLKVPLLTQVWDSPLWWLTENKVDTFSSRQILKLFDKTIKASKCCATACQAMSDAYETKYHISTIPITACLDEKMSCKPIPNKEMSSYIVIGMAGQIYANKEWSSLIAALDGCDWKIFDREVIIRYFGFSFIMSGHKKARIEYMGYRSQADVVQLLSDADILYCPYFFDHKLIDVAETSFPSKLITYFASGRPVLYHGPEYGSPVRYIIENNAGATCYSLEPEDILNSIKQLVSDTTRHNVMSQNSFGVFHRYFTNNTVRKNTLDFFSTALR